MRPNCFRQASTIARTCASSVTSQTCVTISLSLPTRATVSVIDSASRSTANTLAPSRANSTADARPLPQPGPTQPAPLISATFPARRPGTSFSPPSNLPSGSKAGFALPSTGATLFAAKRLFDPRDDLPRRVGAVLEQCVDVGARHQRDIDSRPLGVSQKCRIAQGRREG